MATCTTPQLEVRYNKHSSTSHNEERYSPTSKRFTGKDKSGSQRSLKTAVPRHLSMTSISSVHETERKLTQLLADFEKGRLHAFGSPDVIKKMQEIRKMQERVTEKHLEVDSQLLENISQNDSAKDGKLGTGLAEITSELRHLTRAIQDLDTSSFYFPKLTEKLHGQSDPILKDGSTPTKRTSSKLVQPEVYTGDESDVSYIEETDDHVCIEIEPPSPRIPKNRSVSLTPSLLKMQTTEV